MKNTLLKASSGKLHKCSGDIKTTNYLLKYKNHNKW